MKNVSRVRQDYQMITEQNPRFQTLSLNRNWTVTVSEIKQNPKRIEYTITVLMVSVTEHFVVLPGASDSADYDDIDDKCRQRKSNEKHENCDPSGRRDSAMQFSVVHEVEEWLRQWNNHCNYRQRDHSLLGPTHSAHTHCLQLYTVNGICLHSHHSSCNFAIKFYSCKHYIASYFYASKCFTLHALFLETPSVYC